MKKIMVLILSLVIFFSCKEENGELNKEVEVQKDSIRNTICFNLEYDFDSIRCKNDICDTGICITYENIWKEILLETNNLDNEYFVKHISICEIQIHEWLEGFSFGVGYTLTHDWAETYCYDSFIVKIHAGNTSYPHVYLRRDVFLTKSEILIAINNNIFSSHITRISNLQEIKYNSMINALSQLIDSARVDTLCYRGICIDKVSGNLNLEANGEIVNEYNSCVFGYIDLFTGKTRTEDWPCFYED